ncbi:hypothetical protein [Saccharopolyspora pogona]|uniref:hypothetical protein n=1 Tax=Saccharopolyspora pogona TaxID=333966 RepID=UPI00168727F9|nr:hypothetical protein [Saccharopolyspora pogona]
MVIGGFILVLLLRQQATDTVAQAALQRAEQIAAQLTREVVQSGESWPCICWKISYCSG